jgi:adenosylcobinamide-GDP ribazoletransferase
VDSPESEDVGACGKEMAVAEIGRSFFSTCALISRIPLKKVKEADFSRLELFIPIVGVIVTGIGTGVYWVLSLIIPEAFVIAVVMLLVQYVLFNLFHFDGLLDTADALPMHAEREKRLSVLKDSSVGAYGLFYGTIYIAIKLYVL